MGGHGHQDIPRVQHYSEFKIKGIKQLEELEKALELKGLKDPWIRNEAWRYHPGFGTRTSRAFTVFFRGMPLGAVLAVGTFVAKKVLAGDDHGHDNHQESCDEH